MPYVPVNCTSCGGEIQLDDTKEFGYCLHCGTKVYFQEAIQKVELINLPKVENMMKIATSEFENSHYADAIPYFNRVLELDPENWKAILFKALSQCYVTPSGENTIPAAIMTAKSAFNLAEKEMNDELIRTFFINPIEKLLSSCLLGANFSEFFVFASLKVYEDFLFTNLGVVEGYEFCALLYKKLQNSNSDLINVYKKILSLLSESSKFRLVEKQPLAGANRKYRSLIIQKFEKYKTELLVLEPNAFIPGLNRKEIENEKNCYIATAIYGSYDAPQVVVLRGYRDNTLLETALGRMFVKFYYRVSPKIVTRLHGKTRINSIVKSVLDKIVANIQKQ